MTIRAACIGFLSIASLAFGLVRCSGDDDAKQPRSLLLITIDTLRADHLSCYGYARKTSPRLDALAAAGLRFERCLVPIPRTTQSLASLMTGKYPGEHGVLTLRDERYSTLAPEHETLAERFRASGFATGAAVVLPFMDDGQGLDQGFDEYALLPGEARANTVTDAALAWITKHKGERFAFWAHYRDPHAPYYPPKPWNDSFDAKYEGPLRDYYHYWPVTPDLRPQSGGIPEALRAEKGLRKYGAVKLPPRDIERAIALYDGEIVWTDSEIARLLDGIKRLGLDDEVAVVVTADHGESLGEHDYWFDHGDFLYDTCLRVPLIVSGPGVAQAAIREQVGAIDIAPTLLEWFDLPAFGPVSGRSFHAALEGRAIEGRTLFAESGEPLFASTNPRFRGIDSKSVSVLDRLRARCQPSGDKLIVDPLFSGPYAATLFRTATDPNETVDHAEDADLAPRLTPAIDALRGIDAAEVGRIARGAIKTDPLDPAAAARAREELEQAGYVGTATATARRGTTIRREQEPIPGTPQQPIPGAPPGK